MLNWLNKNKIEILIAIKWILLGAITAIILIGLFDGHY